MCNSLKACPGVARAATSEFLGHQRSNIFGVRSGDLQPKIGPRTPKDTLTCVCLKTFSFLTLASFLDIFG